MAEENRSERAKEKLRSKAGPVHIESSAAADTTGELIPAPQVAQMESPDSHARDSHARDSHARDSHVTPPSAHAEPPKDSVESEIQAVEATFAKGLTDKMSHATIPGARELAEVVGDPDAHDEELAKVVADPYAEEKHWYAACVAAGHRCLAGLPSPVRVAVVRTAALFGVIFSFLSIMASYVSSIYFSAHIGTVGSGLTMDGYINELVGLDYVGFLTAGAAILLFWSSFFGFYKMTIRYVTIFLFTCIMVKALNFHLVLNLPLAALVSAAYFPILFLGEWLGGACREALPMHIGSKQLAKVMLPSVAAPALTFLLSMVLYISSGAANEPSHYGPGSIQTLLINIFAVSICTFIPGFVLARTTKSKSPAGSAALAVVLQTPLLIGLLLTIGACLVLAMVYQTAIPSQPDFLWMRGFGGGDWAHFGGPKALSVLGGILLAAVTAAGGGAFGAWLNNKYGVKADEKPLHADLR